MSLLSKVFSTAKGIVASPVGRVLGGVLGGPVGAVLSTAATAYGIYQATRVPAAPSPTMTLPQAMPGVSSAGMFPTSFGGALPAVGRVGGAAVRYGVAGAKRVYQSAASYCRKHPGWCQTIGGIAAVEAMIQGGQLPAIKARRGRGITATELKNFRRVARFTSKYCAPVRRAMSSRAVRGGKSCR